MIKKEIIFNTDGDIPVKFMSRDELEKEILKSKNIGVTQRTFTIQEEN